MNSVKVISTTQSIGTCKFRNIHEFDTGYKVPVIEVFDMHSLNQIVGYAKFINQTYGQVYYRGQCQLYNNMRPSLFRSKQSTNINIDTHMGKLSNYIKTVLADGALSNVIFGKNTNTSVPQKEIVECILQHYGGRTRYIDLVDTLWIALWMGQFRYDVIKQKQAYAHYTRRDPSFLDLIKLSDEDYYQYILLVAVPDTSSKEKTGFRKIDLRKELPSTFLRPHAQHALVARKTPCSGGGVKSYDFADSVVGILKIRIDRACSWLGNGMLVSQENLFPPPAYDHGYDILLSREDIFNQPDFAITKYV